MLRPFLVMLSRNVDYFLVPTQDDALLLGLLSALLLGLLFLADRLRGTTTAPAAPQQQQQEEPDAALMLEAEKEAEKLLSQAPPRSGVLTKRASLLRQNSGDGKKVKFSFGDDVPAAAGATTTTASTSVVSTATAVASVEEASVLRFVRILFGTFRGRAKGMASKAAAQLSALGAKKGPSGEDIVVVVHDLADFFPENLLKADEIKDKKRKVDNVVIFVVSTYSGGTCPESCKPFFAWIDDCVKDFRVPRDYLASVRFAVFGLGNSSYDPEHFCTPSRKLEHDLLTLGAFRMSAPGFSDEAIGGEDECFHDWFVGVTKSLKDDIAETLESLNLYNKVSEGETVTKSSEGCCNGEEEGSCSCKSEGKEEASSCSCKSGESGKGDCSQNGFDDENEADLCSPEQEDELEDQINTKVYELGDLEDLALPAGFSLKKKMGESLTESDIVDAPREMVTLTQRKQLTKEGYKIIGTHSAVKLCRWTKAQLRGRGGCYKHTFYNITSHNCMEATPSLACANKCTFCWRHNRHPVGKEWRWKMDPPEMIVDQAIEFHRRMIKELRGMPGLLTERYDEAMNGPHHCALSLVGEPIMYPRINDLLAELHRRRISSFLVTNAQFPDAIERLDPVTQLYVSVDAPSRDELKSVDRPLFSDFWERLHASLTALKRKKQRTVYRLTLIKGQNMGTTSLGEEGGEERPWTKEALEGYVRLVRIGDPDFIEVKGVTYCGKGDETKPTLLMQNVPWHREVRGFCEALCELISDDYGLACEHSHSLCVLLARKDRFFHPYGGKWHTWIDFEKFHDLVASGAKDFSSQDYTCETPKWALYASKEEGFDPLDTRWRRNKVKRSSVDSAAGNEGKEVEE